MLPILGRPNYHPPGAATITDPTVSICIPFYTGREYLKRCLNSLDGASADTTYEIVVIEDAGPESADVDGPVRVRHAVNASNLGFGGTVNRAIEMARGEFLLVLNSDAELRPGAIDHLVETMQSDGRLAAVGPLVTNADGTYQPQCRRGRLTPLNAALYFTGLARFQSPDRAYIHPEVQFSEAEDVAALSGCCVLLRRAAFDAVGGFDDSMRLYGEDLDLCYRLRDDGWRLRFEPAACVLHHGGKGGTEARPWHSRYHYHRSMARLFRKHGAAAYPLYGWAVNLVLWGHLLGSATVVPLRRRGVATPKEHGRAVPEAVR